MISKRIRGALTLLLFIITLVSYCFGWYGIANLGDSDAEMILFGFFQLVATFGVLIALIPNLTSLRKKSVSVGRRVINLVTLIIASLGVNGTSIMICCYKVLDDSMDTGAWLCIVDLVIIIMLIVLNIKTRFRE
ncbi:MAG: hypothetical protein MJZ22_02985 [Candidatus Saccharibacteria bacterium]|nr:hypothetical protein [Candidatus Saccharibacteria bacterium]